MVLQKDGGGGLRKHLNYRSLLFASQVIGIITALVVHIKSELENPLIKQRPCLSEISVNTPMGNRYEVMSNKKPDQRTNLTK